MASPYFSLLEALRTHHGLPEFSTPLPSNQFQLELQDGFLMTIEFDEETEKVLLFAKIGVYPPKEELAVLSKIAEANFLGAATAGGTLSAHPDTRTLYFGYQFPINTMESPAFIQLIEKFVGMTQLWKDLLTSKEQTPSNDNGKYSIENLA